MQCCVGAHTEVKNLPPPRCVRNECSNFIGCPLHSGLQQYNTSETQSSHCLSELTYQAGSHC